MNEQAYARPLGTVAIPTTRRCGCQEPLIVPFDIPAAERALQTSQARERLCTSCRTAASEAARKAAGRPAPPLWEEETP